MGFGGQSDSLNRRVFLIAAAALAGAGVPASAMSAQDYVQAVAKDVMALASSGLGKQQMRARFNGIINKYSDIKQISLRALGTYQKELKAGDKAEFFKLCLAYVSAFFVYYADEFRGATFAVKSTVEQGKFTTIVGEVRTKNGDSSPVRWRLVPAGSGFRLHDVNVRGVWLSLALKDRFTDILKRSKGDFAPLFEELRSAEEW